MTEIIKAIMEKPELLARYKALGQQYAAELAKIARDAGFHVTEQEIASELAKAEGELSEESLSQVAAGYLHYSCEKRANFR